MKEAIDAIGAVAPAAAIGLFALPSYLGVLRQKGFLKGLFILLVLGIFAIGLDALVIKTNVLYQDFTYADSLGYKLFGSTPWSIGLAYPPLLLTTFWLASKLTKGRGRLILTTVLMVFTGLVFSPALFKLRLWETKTGGLFYGVPLTNFLILAVVGLVGGWLLLRLWGKDSPVKPSVAYSGLAMLLFWSGVNIGVEQWVPVGTGLFASLIVLVVLIIEKRALKHERARNV